MKRSYYIRLSTILGLSIIILIQCIWLYTSYTFARNELSVRMTDMLEQAMMEESFSRIHQLPFGTRVQGRTEKDRNRNIPEFVYMQEALEELNKPISLDTLSHIYKLLLQNNKYPQECVLTIADTQHIIQQTEGELPFSFFTLKSDKVPLRKDHSITIQAQIINPNNLYFQKMGLLLISTTILVALVIACIIYQINIIARMNKIIRVREDFFHALVHDMKTPLNCISMTLTTLYKNSSTDNRK